MIKFTSNNSPDFTTPCGEGFEVKYCPQYHGHPRWSFTIYPSQWASLLNHPNCKVLVFRNSPEPDYIIPMHELPLGTKHWKHIRIDCHPTNPGSVPRAVYLAKLKRQVEARHARQDN